MSKFTEYANSFQAVARLELESIKRLTEILGSPEKDLKFIHVAGTNGKGSVCAILQVALTHAGYKTGKYISPNLIDVCERISIDGKEITPSQLEKIMDKVKTAADMVYEETKDYPTQFELWTAAAFLYFKEQNVDLVVLETGLGGQRDATNVVKNTICSVITKISIDHISYLGGTIEKIAEAKAGIIKNGGITVSVVQEPDAMKIIEQKATEMSNPLYIANTPSSNGFREIYEKFDLEDEKDILCGLGGLHQLENASVASEVLKRIGIDAESIRYGIENAKNPARFEIVSKSPLVIFDGAHNPDGIEALAFSINRYFSGKRINFVMGLMADKDLDEMLFSLKERGFNNSSKFYTVTVKDNSRAMDNKTLADILCKNGFSAFSFDNVSNAILTATEDADVVFIMGSLYLYKDFSAEKQELALKISKTSH